MGRRVTKEEHLIDATKVFVVHGRNRLARDAIFAFLRSISLHPLEWSEMVQKTGKGSPYIGEVLEEGFSSAQAIIVLMTPDDEARLRHSLQGPDEQPDEKNLTPQPRQNVLIEAGMALGLHQDRTIIIELGRLRPVSDTLGRHVIRMNDSADRRNELLQRLKTAGCEVNAVGTDWLRAGSFSSSVQEPTEHHDVLGVIADKGKADSHRQTMIGHGQRLEACWKHFDPEWNRQSQDEDHFQHASMYRAMIGVIQEVLKKREADDTDERWQQLSDVLGSMQNVLDDVEDGQHEGEAAIAVMSTFLNQMKHVASAFQS
jgi:predicted nucleotide-binding protein